MSWDAFQREVLVELGHVLYATAQPAGERVAIGDAAAAIAADAAIHSTMLQKVARAAGMDAAALLQGHAELAAICGQLHGDAAAKRRLWPRLRALRRAAR